MSTDKVKASPFNPVDHMETDEEIIEFIVDCYDEDPEGRVYLRACQFLGDSRGTLKTYEILQRATREIASRNQQPAAPLLRSSPDCVLRCSTSPFGGTSMVFGHAVADKPRLTHR